MFVKAKIVSLPVLKLWDPSQIDLAEEILAMMIGSLGPLTPRDIRESFLQEDGERLTKLIDKFQQAQTEVFVRRTFVKENLDFEQKCYRIRAEAEIANFRGRL